MTHSMTLDQATQRILTSGKITAAERLCLLRIGLTDHPIRPQDSAYGAAENCGLMDHGLNNLESCGVGILPAMGARASCPRRERDARTTSFICD
jgi:hypothetical protein